ncbi:LacI family transcriptional regulator [Arthrobacter sp. AG258]|uniref:LacI family DNA-binding transcriptional regulator n=1 Tax=Arthrobacter sp. AG258 TaxID=2183899 RepID=UPI0010602CC8|nr:LacI family DNA-binding transcriptional regulator [Arthrobacter sp. AG258]TDT74702.1 LacI family transcriptional regulator [Arthrobacter sp. AG258]
MTVSAQVARRATISDVAALAGVSIPTVSRYLTGSTPVSAAKREAVERAIHELDYRPNGAARQLGGGKKSLISVLTTNTTRLGYANTLQGIEQAGRDLGYMVAITVLDGAASGDLERTIDLATSQPTAGVLVIDFDPTARRALGLIRNDINSLAVTSHLDQEHPQVRLDDYEGGRKATEYLLALGHRTVHYVATHPTPELIGRTSGWQEALEDAGAPIPGIITAAWTIRSGFDAGLDLVRDPTATAVLCGNDEIAFGVIRAFQTSGKRVPEDISVIGFDNHPHAEFWEPGLTTIDQDFVNLGSAAVRALVGAPGESAAPKAKLIVRGSTGPAPKDHV